MVNVMIDYKYAKVFLSERSDEHICIHSAVGKKNLQLQ